MSPDAERYLRKRFSEVLDEYGLLDEYVFEDDSPEFEREKRRHACFVDRMITEVEGMDLR
ncbi:hypothetical protein ACFPA8_07885 [Streptomyces ovatisporus]|uniref:Uncharacterized protein n=1 Tax=Streptomyces ovatisporus TaxID=1128682 RepID=A0ABV9A910_9ACTN